MEISNFKKLVLLYNMGLDSFPTGTATMGGMAIPVQFGFYEVTFNLNTGDYSFEIPVIGIVGRCSQWLA